MTDDVDNLEPVGQALHGTTWGGARGQYDDYANGRFAWFKQAKFGIFIHWGLYSLLEGEWQGQAYHGIAEWIMRVLRIPVDDYAELAGQFDPRHFDADAWLDLFRDAVAATTGTFRRRSAATRADRPMWSTR